MTTKVEIRKIEEGIAKWRTKQQRKKLRVLYLYIPANLLLLAAIFLSAAFPLLSPLCLIPGLSGLLLYGAFIWYSYSAFWRDATGKVLLKRLEKMKKREVRR